MRFKGFIGAAYTLDSMNMEVQRCVNMYPVVDESGQGKEGETAYLQGTPGTEIAYTLDAVLTGGYVASNGFLYLTTTSGFYYVDPTTQALHRVGNISGDNRYFSMVDNGDQLIIVTGNKGYIYTISTNTLALITSTGFVGSDFAVFFDNFIVVNQPNSNVLYLSKIGDASIYDPLDRFKVDGTPEPILRHINLHRELWIFKANNIEVFYNTGNLGTPFQRETGIFIERGCVSGNTVVKLNNTILWVGRGRDGDGIVYMANGYETPRVSTFHVERLINSEGVLTGLQAYGQESEGHVFYCVNLTSTTLVFDLTTNMWHERNKSNPNDLTNMTRHDSFFAVNFLGKILIGSYFYNYVFNLSKLVVTDNNSPILRLRSSPHVSSGLKRLLHRFIQIDIETGLPPTGFVEVRPPQISIDTSDDNGRTWVSKIRSMGNVGEYRHRVRVNRLGSSRNRVYRVRFSEPYPFALIGAEIQVESTTS